MNARTEGFEVSLQLRRREQDINTHISPAPLSAADVQIVWQLTDLFNGLMALPNLCALLALSPEALSLLKSWTEAKTGAAGRPGRRHNQRR